MFLKTFKLKKKIDLVDFKIEECVKPDMRHLKYCINETNETLKLLMDHFGLKIEDSKKKIVKIMEPPL